MAGDVSHVPVEWTAELEFFAGFLVLGSGGVKVSHTVWRGITSASPRGTERIGFLIADSEGIGGPALFGRKGFDINCAFQLRRLRLIDGWADVALSI